MKILFFIAFSIAYLFIFAFAFQGPPGSAGKPGAAGSAVRLLFIDLLFIFLFIFRECFANVASKF